MVKGKWFVHPRSFFHADPEGENSHASGISTSCHNPVPPGSRQCASSEVQCILVLFVIVPVVAVVEVVVVRVAVAEDVKVAPMWWQPGVGGSSTC